MNLAQENIDSGKVTLTKYTVSKGERLWNIAKGLCTRLGVDRDSIDIRNLVEAIKCYNEVMGVDVSVIYEGQTIYLPDSLEGIVD